MGGDRLHHGHRRRLDSVHTPSEATICSPLADLAMRVEQSRMRNVDPLALASAPQYDGAVLGAAVSIDPTTLSQVRMWPHRRRVALVIPPSPTRPENTPQALRAGTHEIDVSQHIFAHAPEPHTQARPPPLLP
eukprot:7384508-Prymnesium_polylepis.1